MAEKKGKYGALIQQARAGNQTDGLSDDQITSKPDDQKARAGDQPSGLPVNQTDGLPDDQVTRKPESQSSGKPDDQIASEPESQRSTPMQKTSEPENQLSDKPALQLSGLPEIDRAVNLTVKVPESLRRHWAAEAKRQGTTMTDVITVALLERFGRP